jgi:hypothetical protein
LVRRAHVAEEGSRYEGVLECCGGKVPDDLGPDLKVRASVSGNA